MQVYGYIYSTGLILGLRPTNVAPSPIGWVQTSNQARSTNRLRPEQNGCHFVDNISISNAFLYSDPKDSANLAKKSNGALVKFCLRPNGPPKLEN